MAKTEFGQELSSQSANDVYLLKTEDDIITGILSFQQGTNINKHLTDVQEHIYTLGQIVGIVGENDPNALIYSSTNYIANGDDRKVVVEKLDAQIKLNADNIALNVIAIAANAANIAINAQDIADIIASLGVDSGTAPLAVGIATLDANGKVPLSQLSNSLLQYLGTWDASTNTPTLADGTGVENTWYRVNVAGSQDLGSGSITFAVGDKIVHNGTIWEKWDTNDEVTSVHGRTGDVVALAGDYNATQVGLGNVTNDAQLKREAGDLNTFTEKASPVDADIVIIEDSEDSFNKKKVLLENLGLGGGGSGGINHLQEQAKDSDLWTDDTNLTISNNLLTPVREDEDLQIDKAAVDASGEVIPVPFTIDRADRAKTMPLCFDYINNAAYDGGFEVELWDVTNAKVVDVNTNPTIISRDILIGSHLTYWQPSIDSTSYELRIKCITTDASAMTMNIANLKTGPVNCQASGAFKSDWTKDGEWVPTGSWTANATYTGKYYRDGNILKGWVEVVCSANPTPDVVLAIDIPFSIDGSVLPDDLIDNNTGHFPVGQVFTRNPSTLIGRAAVTQSSVLANRVECFYDNNAAFSQDTLQTVNQSGGGTIGAGDIVRVEFELPIVGWENGILPTEVVSGREITAIATVPGTQSIASGGDFDLDINAFTRDTAGIGDHVANSVTIPESGQYDLSGYLQMSGGNISAAARTVVFLNINGSNSVMANIAANGPGGYSDYADSFARSVYLNKGDVVKIQVNHSTGSNQTVAGNTTFTITRNNSLNAQISPTDTIAASYTSDSGQSVPHADAANAIIIYEDKVRDTHNMYNPLTGKLTVPFSGRYAVSAGTKGVTVLNIALGVLIIYVDNVQIGDGPVLRHTNDTLSGHISFELDLLAGQELDIRMFQANDLTTAQNLNTAPNANYFNITKVGN